MFMSSEIVFVIMPNIKEPYLHRDDLKAQNTQFLFHSFICISDAHIRTTI